MVAASARYRAKKKAEAGYTTNPIGRQPKAPTVSGAGLRAATAAAAGRLRRKETLEALPSVRNTESKIYVPREPGRKIAAKVTKAGQARQAEAVREAEAAKKLQAIGRARKNQLVVELHNGPNTERMLSSMSGSQQQQFQALSERIASVPNQAIAILFQYEGGQGDYNSIIERILASPESRDVEDALGKLRALTELAERAGELYAPKRIGRLTV